MNSDRVSVIVPARKEPYIRETLRDLFANAGGDIEVILFLDGHVPEYKITRRKNLTIVKHDTPYGMRPCINEGAKMASGKYLMKLDAHCTIGENWDEILKADCEPNWIVIPRRYWFDAPTWTVKDRPPVDAMLYLYPFIQPYRPRLTCRPDEYRAINRAHIEIDEDMGFQGSMWFMQREHFFDRLGGMDTKGYGTFSEEPQEIGLKTQLGPWGGKIIRNKRTWYAHWSKPSSHWRNPPDEAGRVTEIERESGYVHSWDHWWNNKWTERKHDFIWLVEKFEEDGHPLRTWPENWRWLVKQYTRYKIEELWPI